MSETTGNGVPEVTMSPLGAPGDALEGQGGPNGADVGTGATEGLEGAEKGSGDATLGAARLVRAWATDHGEQRLYHVSPPMGWGRDYVVVSAIEQPAETLIFTGDNDEADPITDLEELPGSLRGVCDHEAALRAAGYIVSSGDAT